jgi:hypothetical protein
MLERQIWRIGLLKLRRRSLYVDWFATCIAMQLRSPVELDCLVDKQGRGGFLQVVWMCRLLLQCFTELARSF